MVAATSWNNHTYRPSSRLLGFGENDLDQNVCGDSSLSSFAVAKSKPRRTVRFSFVENVVALERHPSDDCDLYLSIEDREGFVDRARQDCAKQWTEHRKHIKQLEAAYHRCGNSLVSKAQQKEDVKAIFEWANSGGRGLERGVTKVFRRDEYIKHIVSLHKNLASTKATSCSDDAAQALRAFSRNRTRAPREFAYKLGLSHAFSVNNLVTI